MAEKATKSELEELIKFVTVSLVSSPDDVRVELVEEKNQDVYEVDVADNDIGLIIGREGKTANSLRNIVRAACPRAPKKIEVEILE